MLSNPHVRDDAGLLAVCDTGPAVRRGDVRTSRAEGSIGLAHYDLWVDRTGGLPLPDGFGARAERAL